MNACRRIARLMALLCALAACVLHAMGANPGSDARPILHPVKVSLLLDDHALPPAETLDWQPVTLPDNWGLRGFTPEPRPVWYRIEFVVPQGFDDDGAWAMYFQYLYDGGQIFLNGKRVGAVPEETPDIRVKWERPHLIALPYGSSYGNGLAPGSNVVHLRLPAPKPGATVKVPAVVVAPTQLLQDRYERRLFFVRTVAQFTSGTCFAVGAFALFIWWRRRTEVLYGIFGLMTLLWGVRTLTFVIEVLPTAQWDLWRLTYQSATGGFVVMMALFALRTAELNQRWIERFLIVYALIGPIVLIVGGMATEAWVSQVWTGGFFFVSVIIVSMICLAAWRQRTGIAIALMFSVLTAVLAASHDYFLMTNARWLADIAPDWVASRTYVLQYAANAVMLVMGSILASRFLNALFDLETLNATLDRRVAERETVIEQNYKRLLELEGQRQAAEERQRIMQDMHDGLGAQLFSSLSRSERSDLSQQEMSDALRGCIAEMRLAIDSLSTSEDDFATHLSDFRYRWEPQLRTLGIESRWHTDLAPDAPAVTPHACLQILRILQEALTNALKHSRAGLVHVRLRHSGAGLHAEIEDNGVGLAASSSSHGRGMRNMRTRAGRLGGELVVTSMPGQTILYLRVPSGALAVT